MGLGRAIYGRYGYGLAARVGRMSLARERVDFAEPFTPRGSLPLDHPLFLLLVEPRRMAVEPTDGIRVRLLDLDEAMKARAFAADGTVVVEVRDAFLPRNAGRFRIGEGGAGRTDEPAELALDVSALLGSAYLGGFSSPTSSAPRARRSSSREPPRGRTRSSARPPSPGAPRSSRGEGSFQGRCASRHRNTSMRYFPSS